MNRSAILLLLLVACSIAADAGRTTPEGVATKGASRKLKQYWGPGPYWWWPQAWYPANTEMPPINLTPKKLIKAPSTAPSGFGSSVTVPPSASANLLLVQGQWTTAAGAPQSALFTAANLANYDYTAWAQLPEPSLPTFATKPRFGSSVALAVTGAQLLASVDSLAIPLQGTTRVPIGYLYRQTGAGQGYVQSYGPFEADVEVRTLEQMRQMSISTQTGRAQVAATNAMMASDASVVAFSTLLSVSGTDASGRQVAASAAGDVYIYQRDDSTATGYTLFQQIEAPTATVAGATFGKVSAMSADGMWLAVAEDVTASVYFYGRDDLSEPFQLFGAANKAPLFDTTDGTGKIVDIALSSNGQFLVAAFQNPVSGDPAKSQTGAFATFDRKILQLSANNVINHQMPFYHFVQDCVVQTGLPSLLNMRISTVGTNLRVALGFLGQSYVYDLSMESLMTLAPYCPTNAKYIVPAVYHGPGYGAVDLSGDGQTLVIGAQDQNGVFLVAVPTAGSSMPTYINGIPTSK